MHSLARFLVFPSLPLLFLIGGVDPDRKVAPDRLLAQNIVVNGGFDTGLSPWSPAVGFGTAQWSQVDANGSPSSGSLLLINDAALSGQNVSVSQCQPLQGGISYDLAAKIQPVNFCCLSASPSNLLRIHHTGNLYALLNFYPKSPCQGSPLGEFVRVDAVGSNVWQSLGQTFTAPASAASVLVTLAIFKAEASVGPGHDLRANFDDISVVPSGTVAAPPVADFAFSPSSPSAGQPVQFGDSSTGAPTGWSWDFGDPASGASNTSLLQNPTHAFAQAGVYNVTLTASNAGGTGFRTRAVTVTAPSSTTRAVSLPVAGHVTGAGGVVFLTDAEIENPNASAVAANLFFFPVGGGPPRQSALSLGPFETRCLPDVVANQFGVTDSFGALRLETSGSPPARLRMTSRTYDRVGAGSFGMAISGVADGDSPTTSRVVTGIQRNDLFRTNLGAVNDSPAAKSFSILLRGADGGVLGTSPIVTLPPSGQWQVGVKDLFPTVFGSALSAEFQSAAGSAVPFGYGALVDNESGDPTYFPSARPAPLALLPVISRVTGVGGAVFSSDVTLTNVSDSSEEVTLTFWERNRDNSSGAPRVSLALAPRETRLIVDALNALFGLSETFGALKVESRAPLAVAERIWTASPTTAGTVGQQVDPVIPEGFYSRGSILGLRQDSAFRSNAGFVNPNDSAATIALTLRRPDGTPIALSSVTVPPLGFIQASLPGLFPGVTFPPGELLTIALEAGGLRVCAYGIVADNVSQDLTASPGLP